MTYSRFKELPVWQEAIKLAEEVSTMTESRNWMGRHKLPPYHPLRKGK